LVIYDDVYHDLKPLLRAKPGALMQKFGVGVSALTFLVVGSLLLYFQIKVGTAHADGSIDAPVDISKLTPNAQNGEYIFSVAGCASCHSVNGDTKNLGGGSAIGSQFGEFYAPNISPDKTHGIGSWTTSDFFNAVTKGVSPDGGSYFPIFPYESYANMSAQDVVDMKSYIDSLDPVPTPSKISDAKLPMFLKVTGGLDGVRKRLIKSGSSAPSDTFNSVQSRGQYLVDAVGHCSTCHTPRKLNYALDESEAFKGARNFNGDLAPAIDTSRFASMSGKQSFITGVLESGLDLSGKDIDVPEKHLLLDGFKALTYDDRHAIYTYLSGDDSSSSRELDRACAVDESSRKVISSDLQLEEKVDVYMAKYCRSCHGDGQDFERIFPTGTMESIKNDPAVVDRNNPLASALYTSIKQGTKGSMPKSGPRPSAAETEYVKSWLDSLKFSSLDPNVKVEAGRVKVEETDIMAAIAADVSNRSNDFRYVRFDHLYNSEELCESADAFQRRLTVYKNGFAKFVNSLSYERQLYLPVDVPGTSGLVQRIQLPKLGWSQQNWDLLETKNIFAVKAGSNQSDYSKIVSKLDTNLPIVKADWFVAIASKPDIYNIMLDIPKNIAELERRIGVDPEREIDNRNVIRAGFLEGFSGVSGNNRLIERFDLPGNGYYWKSYDFAGNVGLQSLRENPHGPDGVDMPEGLEPFEFDGGEMIFSLPNGLQAYYLSTSAGDELLEAPVEIVNFEQDRVPGQELTIFNGLSCMTCHESGIISKKDQIRDAITTSSGVSVSAKSLIKDIHPENDELEEIYRADRNAFLDAIHEIGIGDKSEGAVNDIDVRLPGGKSTEIVTYLYGLYHTDLSVSRVAAEFGLSEEALQIAMDSVVDPNIAAFSGRFKSRLRQTGFVSRGEFERAYPILVKAYTGHQPAINAKGSETSDLSEIINLPKRDDRLELEIEVSSNQVSVGDTWFMNVSTNKTCELQLFYEQADGEVLDITGDFSVVVGNKVLQANESRRIPIEKYAGSFKASLPYGQETLTAQCKVGGLGSASVNKVELEKRKKTSKADVSKGLFIDLTVKALDDRTEHDVVSIPFVVTE